MAQNIDPSSVNLNTSSYPAHFFADYYPVDPAQLPADCNLPDASTLTLGNTPLTPLNIACEFTFPDVIAIPPIYNPPVTIPNACLSLDVSSKISTTGAAKKSYLNFTSRGPSACGISIDGLIDVTACESVGVANNITYTGKAKPTGTLALSKPLGQGCDLVLGGNINVDACKEVGVRGGFKVRSHRAGVATGEMTLARFGDCGIEIGGGVDINACSSVTGTGAVTVTSKHGAGGGNITLKPAADGCGLNLAGNIDISACNTVTSGGSVAITSKHGAGGGNITLNPTADGCGLDLAGNINIDGCAEVTSGGSVAITSKYGAGGGNITLTGDGGCGLTLGGNINIDGCAEVAGSGSVTVTSTHGAGEGSITLTDNGECGLTLDGNINITACKTITAASMVNFTKTGFNQSAGSLTVTPSADGCGFTLGGGIHFDAINCVYASGEIEVIAHENGGIGSIRLEQRACNSLVLAGGLQINACDETTLEPVSEASTPIVFYSRTRLAVGSMELVPTLTFGGTKCEKTASITVNAVCDEVGLSVCDYVTIEPLVAAESTATFQFDFGVLGSFTTDIQISLRVDSNPLDCTAKITPIFTQPDPITVPIVEVELSVCENGEISTIKVLAKG